MRSITVAELRKKSPSQMQLVDVRSASEFAAGHIPSAVNIPMEQIEGRRQDLAVDAQVVLVCQAGKRARIAAELLGSDPGVDIAVLEGGTGAWIQAELPLVCCAKTRWSLERQVRLIAGVLALSGSLLALSLNPRWIVLSGVIGLGLSFAGLTDICPMGMLLGKMPWNRPRRCNAPFPGTGG